MTNQDHLDERQRFERITLTGGTERCQAILEGIAEHLALGQSYDPPLIVIVDQPEGMSVDERATALALGMTDREHGVLMAVVDKHGRTHWDPLIPVAQRFDPPLEPMVIEDAIELCRTILEELDSRTENKDS